MNDKLLPCPFCGCQDIEYDNCDSGSGEWLACNGCGAEIRQPYNSDESLSKKWNTRTPIVQQPLSGSDDLSSSPKSCANCRNYKNCNYQIERECDLKDRKHWVRT